MKHPHITTDLVPRWSADIEMWKQLLGYAVLVFFVAVGIAHALRRERFMKPWHRGGETLTAWNRFGIRIAGIVVAAVSIYILYSIMHR